MSRPHNKYASDLKLDKNWIYAPGQYFRLDWLDYSTGPETCFLVAIDQNQMQLLISCLIVTRFKRNWGWIDTDEQWAEIQGFVDQIEACLMAGCDVQDLIATQRMMVAALAGEAVDLTTDLPDNVDYTATGVAPAIRELRDRVAALEVKLDGLGDISAIVDALDKLEEIQNERLKAENAVDVLGGP